MEPERQFYIREISRETQIPYGMVYKELDNLEQLGIITSQKKGKITLLQVNKETPYYEDLRNLIMKTTGIANIIQNHVKHPEIAYLLIFGSIASGKDTPESDIDLMIIGDISEKELIEEADEIEKNIGREINYILWTHTEFEKKIKEKNHILIDVAEKPIIMLKGSEDEFRGSIEKGLIEEHQAQPKSH
ncbi:MAG: nucleotidyltransferase domain-containing protein [Candidatus Bathyarchaeota archaeon]|nr:nucleotidyltransferase domain-containing protein [Candidatus Bathyarchaeota archaeon]